MPFTLAVGKGRVRLESVIMGTHRVSKQPKQGIVVVIIIVVIPTHFIIGSAPAILRVHTTGNGSDAALHRLMLGLRLQITIPDALHHCLHKLRHMTLR